MLYFILCLYRIYVKEYELEGQLSPAWVKNKWESLKQKIYGVESSPHRSQHGGREGHSYILEVPTTFTTRRTSGHTLRIYVKEYELEGQLSPAWVKKKWESLKQKIHGFESSPHRSQHGGREGHSYILEVVYGDG
ncbi:hypothetical protein J4Q44_G00006940 [Coregonus suidteri]|uniref:Uncharacterized protein n=1 Tax=Coregonus suidteri TaxID=861788 RepID=A0AAN8R802_9TELE